MSQVLQPLIDDSISPPARVPDFFFDPKTDIIYFWKSIENRKIKFSTRIARPNIDKARRFANRELTRRLNKKKVRAQTLIKDELDLWLKVKESEGLDESTLGVVRRVKKRLEEFWGTKFPHEINRDNITAWYAWWQENYAGQQMYNHIKYLRNFCRYLAEKIVEGYPQLPAVPTIKDPRAREHRAARKKKKERIITQDEFTRIKEAAECDDHRLVVQIMYTMATRIDETLNLRFGHEIQMTRPELVYRWGVGQNKADLEGEHLLHPSLIEPLRALSARREAEGTSYLFPQIRNNQQPLKAQQIDWEAWRKRAAIGWHWTPHTFRHTCLSLLFNDPSLPQALICMLYRVSMKTAMEHYIKPTQAGLLTLKAAIKVEL